MEAFRQHKWIRRSSLDPRRSSQNLHLEFPYVTARYGLFIMSRIDDIYAKLQIKTGAKLVLVVLDGLGDVATREQGWMTPLEAATTPNLDGLVSQGCAQGRMIPVAPGITPGSGPGHLALFGYDPIEFEVGRGVIETLGLGIELKKGEVAARANFCTLNDEGIVTDRRAGRIATEVCERLCGILSAKIKKLAQRKSRLCRARNIDSWWCFAGRDWRAP